MLSYLKTRTKAIWDAYAKTSGTVKRSNKGLRFDDPIGLAADVAKFAENNGVTNQRETGATLTATQKQTAIFKAILAHAQKPGNLERIKVFSDYSRQVFADYFTLKVGVIKSAKTNNTLGTINYKKQLTDYFKTNNIQTYSLNPPAV